ncbi:MAG TPA: ModE family transcriptional regulator [Candidatus Merdenecus merdavium]|nr:ModE family transcriptional regulator [Candidatus Merdenecus merdavium]
MKGEDKFFGPGISKLMHLVDTTGSLRKSCSIMGMSYSKAWKIIKIAEKNLGFPLLISSVGGSGGGNSVISPEGREFLNSYDAFVEESQNLLNDVFSKYFKNNF